MKKLVILIAVLLPIFVIGQSQDENYIHTKTFREAVANESPTTDKIEVISYHDGLGRSKQTLALRYGGNGEHHVTPITYDSAGRVVKNYLPYPNTVNDINIQNTSSLISNQEVYYQGKYAADFTNSNLPVNAHSETRFEKSPVNRPLAKGNAGQDWGLVDAGNTFGLVEHSVKYDYQTNGENEVIRYDVTFDPSGSGINPERPNLVSDGYYEAGELLKNITKDENWTPAEGLGRTIEEFTDKSGRMILKRTYSTEIDANDNPIYLPHDTQYIYDEYGNLTYVLSPKGSDARTFTSVGYPDFSLDIPLEDVYAANSATILDPIGIAGTVNVSMTGGDQLTVNWNFSVTQSGHLRTGAIIMLPNAPQNVILGTINVGAAQYEISIENEFLVVEPVTTEVQLLSGISFNQTVTGTVPSEQVVNISNGVLNKLCYQYRYDYRNRLIRKRLPGKQWEEIVYDYLDRPVFTQDPNLKARGLWLFTKYDDFNRVIYTGFYSSTQTRSQLQNILQNETLNNEKKTTNPQTFGGHTLYYTNTVIPNDAANMEILTVNYYDDYNFFSPVAVDDVNTPIFGQAITSLTKDIPTGSEVKVLNTNNWIRNIMYYDSKARPIYTGMQNDYLKAKDIVRNEYDFIGNLLKSETTHEKRFTQCTGTPPLQNCVDAFDYVITLDEFTYDNQNRLITHVQTLKDIDGNIVQSPEMIVNKVYDELGLLVDKKVGGAVTNITPLQEVDYAYNIRGWLTQINDPSQSLTNDVFAYQINYNTITENNSGESRLNTEKLYNGNISETLWKSATDDKLRGYGYLYDELNRIASARYKAGITFNEEKKFYDLKTVKYDKNGNITKLRRRAPLADFTDHEIIDKLNYKYFNNSNQLKKVNDNATSTSTEGFVDVNIDGTNDYTYDDNGNLTQDLNKNISVIEYNYLNLPTRVVFSTVGNTSPQNGDNAIEYVYDATGVKQEKRSLIYGITTSGTATEYCGNYIYERDVLDISNDQEKPTLQFFNHLGGYVEPAGIDATTGLAQYNYIYQCKDHLGNIRVSISDYDKDGKIDILRDNVDIDGDGDLQNEIVQAKNYYPFGLEYGYGNNNPNSIINGRNHEWAFANKEYNEEFGLNWSDFGARNYDASLGRWMNLDPLAYKYQPVSPYSYVANSVLIFNDPDGKKIVKIEGGVEYTGGDAKTAFLAIKKAFEEDNAIAVHLVSEERTPAIYKHTLNAFRKGKPSVLHYDSNKGNQKRRRSKALSGYPSRYSEGLSRDEYPFASTFEGGEGAEVEYVPILENSRQGGDLGALYKTLEDGDAFLVLPVPLDEEPEPQPEPETIIEPTKTPDHIPVPVVPAPVPTTSPVRTIFNRLLIIITPPFLLSSPFQDNLDDNENYKA